MINVLIADNHPIIRMGVKHVLEGASGIQVIADVATTSELLEALEKITPDVVMLEMDIPEINGIATLRKLKKEHPEIKVLIYSGQSEDVY
ncbi:MAG: response regulator transcription factor, partial [Flavobacteriaceae bacterium]